MKNARRLAVLWLISVFLAGTAHAATSTVNPNVPAQNSPLSSSVLRNGISQPAYNDINSVYGYLTLGANQILGTLSAGIVQPLTIPPCSTALTYTNGVGIGCASGGSGITALTGDVTASGTGSVAATLANSPTARTNIGLGTAATPVFAGLTINGVAKVNLNGAALPSAQTGTALQLGNADTVASRAEVDAFGAAGHFTAVRWDGTNASPTTLQSGDLIGSFNGYGYNGTAVVGPQASFQILANQNWSVGANGTKATVSTTPNGSTTLTNVAQFENDGGMTLPPTVTGGDKGAGTFNATAVYAAGTQLQNGNFTAGTNMTITGTWPNLTFSSSGGGGGAVTLGSLTTANPSISGDLTSGFYTAGAGLVDVSISGVKVGEWSSTGWTDIGKDTAASFVPTGSTIPTDGYYLKAANTSAISDRTLPVVTFTNPASAVNFLSFTGSATGVAPTITTLGGDTNGAGLGLNLSGGAATASGAGGPLTLTGGVGNAAAGGAVSITGGITGGANNGGAVTITGGSSATGTAGNVTIAAGTASGNGFGGNVTISAGGATTAIGNITINGAASGPITLNGGNITTAATNGGAVNINSGSATNTGPGANINLTAGSSKGTGTYNGGNIVLTPGTATVSTAGIVGMVNLAGGAASTGTKFTTSGCSISSTTGGAQAGKFTLGANTCTAVITLNGATTAPAPSGWSCWAIDQTAPTVLIGGNSSSTTTTASFTIPAGAGATDVIAFGCLGY